MSSTPFMPLWVSDFLGDTLDLDAKEVGAYMLLLMAMWQRDGYLPGDQKKLRRVARCGRDWPKIWSSLERFFCIDNGRIYNKRLLQELQKVVAKREVNARNGARGGAAKVLKNKESGLANAKRTLKQLEPEPKKERKRTFQFGTCAAPDGDGRRTLMTWDRAIKYACTSDLNLYRKAEQEEWHPFLIDFVQRHERMPQDKEIEELSQQKIG